MKKLVWAVIAVIVFFAIFFSISYSFETIDECVKEGNSRTYCHLTLRWQNQKRLWGW